LKSKHPNLIVVVTGAASGIGKATALRFAREGYRVAALDRDESGLRRLKLGKFGSCLFPYGCDLMDVKSLAPLCARIHRELGAPRVLVNNAGIHIYSAIEETTDEIWAKSLNVNLLSAAALCREFVPAMKRIKGAAIVNISSRNALSSSPCSVTYDAAKAGLLALTRTLAVELGEFGIRVNAVLPGVIVTNAHKDLFADRRFCRNYHRLIPINRFGTADEIAGVIFFLASDEASFITGQGIVADGGQMSGQNYGKVFGKPQVSLPSHPRHRGRRGLPGAVLLSEKKRKKE
jgi:NAD(P)-dependent dehydrogenase (short-subunit alcohol dehydrogenase family)